MLVGPLRQEIDRAGAAVPAYGRGKEEELMRAYRDAEFRERGPGHPTTPNLDRTVKS